MITIADLKAFLKDKIKWAEHDSEDLIQEYDNEEDANKCLAKAEAYQEILSLLEQP